MEIPLKRHVIPQNKQMPNHPYLLQECVTLHNDASSDHTSLKISSNLSFGLLIISEFEPIDRLVPAIFMVISAADLSVLKSSGKAVFLKAFVPFP